MKRTTGCLGVVLLLVVTVAAWLVAGLYVLLLVFGTGGDAVPPESALVLPPGFTTTTVTPCGGSQCSPAYRIAGPSVAPGDLGQAIVDSLKAAGWAPDPASPTQLSPGEYEIHATNGPFESLYDWGSGNGSAVTEVTVQLDFSSGDAGDAYYRDQRDLRFYLMVFGTPTLLTAGSIWAIVKVRNSKHASAA